MENIKPYKGIDLMVTLSSYYGGDKKVLLSLKNASLLRKTYQEAKNITEVRQAFDKIKSSKLFSYDLFHSYSMKSSKLILEQVITLKTHKFNKPN